MRRRLPPLEQIEAFIEAAEAPTFRVAVSDMGYLVVWVRIRS